MNTNVKTGENKTPTGLPGGFFVYNAEGDEEILFAEQNVIELFGCKDIDEFREYVGNSFSGMVYPEDLIRIQNDIHAQTFNSEKKHDYVRYRIETKQGEIRYVEDFGHLLHGKDDKKYFYVYIVDVDKDEFYNRSRNSFAETQIFSMNQQADRLTGLLNMNTFYEKVQDMMDDADNNADTKHTFIYFDIAHFKLFNENYGFERGDDLLCRMAYTIRKEFAGSVIARLSNDCFIVYTDAKDPLERVNRVHNIILNAVDGVRVEVKAGVYELDNNCEKVGIACDYARAACNNVKHRYDRIYDIYDNELYERMKLQQFVLDKIDDAVSHQDIKVFYQPVIRVETGKICGYEALARWIDEEKGFLSPGEFIPTLEEYHLIHKVDSLVVKKVCEDMRNLWDAGEPVVPVSINLSRLDFELCNIFELTERYIRQYDIPRDMLDIEITESALNDDSDFMQREVMKFKDAGYHIWIDDFGSGYSSLNQLFKYEFDVLKLDLEFLRTCDAYPKAKGLVSHIIQSSRGMGFEPLQEGVETEEQFEFLKEVGCIRAQGYYFGKPESLLDTRKHTKEKGLDWERS